jgi:TRAP-type C4-dicarboxylate transport system permease small subunit
MKIKNILDRISLFLCGVSCVAIAIMMLLMVADAVSRKFVGSIPGGFYTTIAILTILLFLPQGYAQMIDAHISVDLVTSKLSDRKQNILRIISVVLAIFFFGVVTWAGGIKAWEATLAREEWMGAVFYPAWPWRWSIPIGLLIFTLQLIMTAIKEIKTLKERTK